MSWALATGLRAAALALVYGLLIRWLRQVKYELAPRRRPPTWGDLGGSALGGLLLSGLAGGHPLLCAVVIALASVLFFLLWLDAVLYRVFTFELGAGGVGGVVLSNLYSEVVQLSTARDFFRAERRFTLLPGVVLLAHVGILLPSSPGLLLGLAVLLAAYLLPTLKPSAAPSRRAQASESSVAAAPADSGAGVRRALVHDFLRPRLPRIPAGFQPRTEHAALLTQRPTPPSPSPQHGRLRGASVVLLTFESLGMAQLAATEEGARSRARTPFLDSLRDTAVISRHHFCPAPLTNAAHLAWYAGRPVAFTGPWSLAALVQAGYRTAYLTAAIAGHYGLLRILQNAGFQQVIDGPALRRGRPGSGQTLDQELLAGGLPALRTQIDRGPLFLHVHAANTHIPYRVADPQRFCRHDAKSDRGRFLNGVEETDALFAELWLAVQRLLQERGETQPPLLLISSDHGQSFGESGYFSHGSAVSDEQLRVPLLLHHPLLAPQRVRFSTHYDVLPTVLDLLGVQGPPSLGESLFHPDRRAGHLLWDGQPSRRTSNCLGLLLDEHKYSLDLIRDTCIESDWNDRQARVVHHSERLYFEALLGQLAHHQGIQ